MEVLGVFLFLLKSVKAGAVGALCITCSLCSVWNLCIFKMNSQT